MSEQMRLRSAREIADKLTSAQRRAIVNAEEIAIGEMNVNCSDDVLYELALDGLVNDAEGDALTPLGLEVRSILLPKKAKRKALPSNIEGDRG